MSGRAATIGRKDGEGWVLEAQTSDGTPFSLQAPVNFSKEQVVEVANGVKQPQLRQQTGGAGRSTVGPLGTPV